MTVVVASLTADNSLHYEFELTALNEDFATYGSTDNVGVTISRSDFDSLRRPVIVRVTVPAGQGHQPW